MSGKPEYLLIFLVLRSWPAPDLSHRRMFRCSTSCLQSEVSQDSSHSRLHPPCHDVRLKKGHLSFFFFSWSETKSNELQKKIMIRSLVYFYFLVVFGCRKHCFPWNEILISASVAVLAQEVNLIQVVLELKLCLCVKPSYVYDSKYHDIRIKVKRGFLAVIILCFPAF